MFRVSVVRPIDDLRASSIHIIWGLDIAEMTVGHGIEGLPVSDIQFYSRWFTRSRVAGYLFCAPLFVDVSLFFITGPPILVVEKITINRVTFTATVPSGHEGGMFALYLLLFFPEQYPVSRSPLFSLRFAQI